MLRLAVLEAGELVVVVGELAGLGRHQGVQVRSLASSSYNDDNHGKLVLQCSDCQKTYAKKFLRPYFLCRSKQGNEDC